MRVLALLPLLPALAAAQGPGARPQDVVAAVFAAEAQGHVVALVSLLHPEAMLAFKQGFLVIDSLSSYARTLDPQYVDMSRKTILQAVFQVKDRAEFVALSPTQVVERWFRGRGGVQPTDDSASGPFPQPVRHVIGEVSENDSTVHVVFREFWPAIPSEPSFRPPDAIRVITVRRTAAGWRAMMNGGLGGMSEDGGWSFGWSDEP